MPVMCVVQLPVGKDQEKIQSTIEKISHVLIEELELEANQVRVTIEELPRGRYIAGGIMDYEMSGFNNNL